MRTSGIGAIQRFFDAEIRELCGLLPRHSGLRPQFYILTLTAVNVHSPVFCMDADLVLLAPSGHNTHLSTYIQNLATRGR